MTTTTRERTGANNGGQDGSRANRAHAGSAGTLRRKPGRRGLQLRKGGWGAFILISWVGVLALGAPVSGIAGGFALVYDDRAGQLHVEEDGAPVLTYNYGMQLEPGVPENRRRSSYVHPIYGVDGEVLTDDFPEDHHHHRGLSWMWPRMEVDGQEVELWHIDGIRQHFDRWGKRKVSPETAAFTVENEWRLGDRAVARETVRFRIQAAEKNGRAIDIHLRFEALNEPIELQGQVDKGYGGLCLRFGPRQGTAIATDEGIQPEDSDLQPHLWADLSGHFDGRQEKSGAAIFVHPENAGFPNGWTLRHYGFLGPCWPGLEPYTLQPDRPVDLKYRVWVHREGAQAGGVETAYQRFREEIDGVGVESD